MVMLACLAAMGCSKPQSMVAPEPDQRLQAFDVALPGIVASPNDRRPAAFSGPQIAYTYRLGYTLDGAAVAPAQAKAVTLCNRLGVRRCLIVKSDLTRDPDIGGSGSLSLMVDARLAPRFGQQLDAIATDAGGSAAERHVEAEDVTKQIVDTAARVRAKQALADRLLAIIRTANGKVGELVEAEKSYAAVQEDLDAARSLQVELRQRVAMSQVDITYSSVRADGAWMPVSRARDGLAGSFASSIAALVTFVVVALPWAALLALVVWLVRRTGWRPRWPFRRRGAPIA
jgi:hypothetical protein